jgi:chemotaxis protein MotB
MAHLGLDRSIALALGLALATGAAAGCGHSENEWQAQLAKQRQVEAELAEERAGRKSDAEKAAAEVAKLRQQLAHLEGTSQETSAKAAELRKALSEAEARAAALEAMRQRLSALKSKLDELKKFGIETRVRNGLITIVMPGDVLFPPGKETLSPDGKQVLGSIAKVIKDNADLAKRRFQIVGHTDNAPYAGSFKDNVGLSLMRAREVFDYMTSDPAAPKKGKKAGEGGGLSPMSLSAAGFGDLDPIAGSREQQSTEERAKNRRVEIAILPNADELMKLDV